MNTAFKRTYTVGPFKIVKNMGISNALLKRLLAKDFAEKQTRKAASAFREAYRTTFTVYG